jgi:hypothetical protein
MDDLTVERMLAAVARDVPYPPTPSLRAAVTARLAEARPRKLARHGWRLALAAVAADVAIGAAIVLAAPSTRSAIAEFFGIEGSRIERLPTPLPGVTPTPLPDARSLDVVATPLTLATAAGYAGFEPALPDGYDAPVAVYGLDYATQFVVLHYAEFDLWQGRPDGETALKGLPDGTLLEDTTANGVPARWISGGSHIVRALDREGREVAGTLRTVERNTLVWRTAFALYRLETDGALDAARRIAESLP